jgi:hypothetical protein
MATGPQRVSQFQTSLTVDGKDYGVWDTREGGATDADTPDPYRPGGMGPPESAGGEPVTAQLTLRKRFKGAGIAATYVELVTKTGSGEAVVTFQPLDKAGHAFEKPIVWRGVLIGVEPPMHDSNSSDWATFQVTVEPDGHPATG